MPYTYGDALVPVEAIDVAIEVYEPLPTHAPVAPDDDSAPSASASPAASATAPRSSWASAGSRTPRSVRSPAAAGCGSGRRCSPTACSRSTRGALDRTTRSSSFLFGSRELYEWIDGNPRVRMMRTEHTNDPGLIAQQRQ